MTALEVFLAVVAVAATGYAEHFRGRAKHFKGEAGGLAAALFDMKASRDAADERAKEWEAVATEAGKTCAHISTANEKLQARIRELTIRLANLVP